MRGDEDTPDEGDGNEDGLWPLDRELAAREAAAARRKRAEADPSRLEYSPEAPPKSKARERLEAECAARITAHEREMRRAAADPRIAEYNARLVREALRKRSDD